MELINSLCVLLPGSRLFPVLPGNGRITQDDLVVGGYYIPKGVRLMWTLYMCVLYGQHVLEENRVSLALSLFFF